jgi:hypothetical protein
MKHFLKKYERMLSIHHYIAVLRRQPRHMQHVYSALFAGVITSILALGILYFDYGLWRERYYRQESVIEETSTASSTQETLSTESPQDMMSSFFNEAGQKLKSINTSRQEFFNSKETYTKEESGVK